MNSQCIQTICNHVCLPTDDTVVSAACKSCLDESQCYGTSQCVDCLYGSTPLTFAAAYSCTIPDTLTSLDIVFIVLGSFAGLLLLVLFVVFILYKSNRLPIATRLWIDGYLRK